MKKIKVFLSTLMLTSLLTISSFAAGWQSDANGWWWQNADGTWPASSWQWLDGNHDGIAESYYFNANGYLLTNTTTPDGYTVDANGAWIQNGVVQTKSILAESPALTANSGAFIDSTFTSSTNQTLDYYLFTPAEGTANMPLIIYLHSAVPYRQSKELIKTEDLVTYLLAEGKNTVPAYVLMPHSAEGDWNHYFSSISELVNQIIETYTIDASNISITGWSAGANALQSYIVKNPDQISRTVLISPYSNRTYIKEKPLNALKEIPVWIIHESVGFSDIGSEDAVKQLKKAGGTVKETEIKGVTHETLRIFPDGKADTYGVIDWLISQTN